jgi:hypothetical protein
MYNCYNCIFIYIARLEGILLHELRPNVMFGTNKNEIID